MNDKDEIVKVLLMGIIVAGMIFFFTSKEDVIIELEKQVLE